MTDRSTRAGSAGPTAGRQRTDQSANRPDVEPGTPATYGKRFMALLIDWILCLLVAGVLAKVTGVFAAASQQGFWAYPVLIAEYGFFVGLFGQTVGMRLARIRCVPTSGEGVIGVPRALLRGLLLCLIVPPLIIGPGGRGWHDRAAGSIVLHS
jgi:uncharacterized RDD family membrane protein YckC